MGPARLCSTCVEEVRTLDGLVCVRVCVCVCVCLCLCVWCVCVCPQGASEPVGVLKLTSFNARAQRDLKDAIAQLQDKGAKVLLTIRYDTVQYNTEEISRYGRQRDACARYSAEHSIVCTTGSRHTHRRPRA